MPRLPLALKSNLTFRLPLLLSLVCFTVHGKSTRALEVLIRGEGVARARASGMHIRLATLILSLLARVSLGSHRVLRSITAIIR